jgi:hypothetical protein
MVDVVLELWTHHDESGHGRLISSASLQQSSIGRRYDLLIDILADMC